MGFDLASAIFQSSDAGTDQSPSMIPAHSRALPTPWMKFSSARMAAYT